MNKSFKQSYPNILRWLFLIIIFSACTGEISFEKFGIPFKFGEKIENMVLFLLILWLPALKFYKNICLKRTILDLPIFFFLLFHTISVIAHPEGFRFYTKIISLITGYYIAYSLFNDSVWRKRFLYTLLIAGLYSFSFGIYLFIKGTYFLDTPGRILTVFKHPNITAFMANIVIFLSLGILPFTKLKIERIFIIFILTIGLICLAITFSRTAWISFVVSILCLLLITHKKKFTIYLLTSIFLISLTAGIFSKNIREKSLSLLKPQQEVNVLYRIKYCQGAVNMVSSHPFTGIGMGQKKFMEEYKNYMVEQTVESPIHCHNTYLQTAATVGIGALLSLLWIIITAFIGLSRNITAIKIPSFDKGFYIGILVSLISFCIGFIAECPIYFTNIMLVFWLLLTFSNPDYSLHQWRNK